MPALMTWFAAAGAVPLVLLSALGLRHGLRLRAPLSSSQRSLAVAHGHGKPEAHPSARGQASTAAMEAVKAHPSGSGSAAPGESRQGGIRKEPFQTRLDALFELMPDAVLSVSAAGFITASNPAAENLFQPTMGSLLGLPVDDLLASPEGLPGRSVAEMSALRPTGWLTRGLRSGGPDFPVKVLARRIAGHGEDELLLVITDQSLLMHTEEQWRRSHALFRTLYENAPVMVAGFDGSGHCVLWNREAERVLGWSLEELGRFPDHMRLLFPDPRERDEARRLLFARDGTFRDLSPTARDGRRLAHEWASFELDDGLIVCTGHDVTARRQVEGRLRATSHELDAILQNVMVGIAQVVDGRFQHVNRRLGEMLDEESHALVGRSVVEFTEDTAALPVGPLHPPDTGGKPWHRDAEIRLRRSDGSLFWCGVSVTCAAGVDGGDSQIWLFEDITRRRHTEEQLRELASYDPLTGLPNRSLFIQRLNEAVNGYHSDEPFTLMFIDLDHFKDVNDSLGHRAGDDLLCQVAKRLSACVNDSGIVARLGGDEFTVFVAPGLGDAAAAALAERIIAEVAQPFLLEGHEARVSPSVGISRYPMDGEDVGVLLRNADTAMYLAKSAGRNTYRFYSPELHEAAQSRMRLVSCLRRAVEHRSFTLVYQPLVNLHSGAWTGVEALLRLPQSELGAIGPDVFVPILEETGLIVELGAWVLEQALADTQALRAAGLVLAVNISGRQFRDDDFVEQVAELLQRHAVPAELLEFELTETVLMADTRASVAALDALSGLGVRLAVDDFGMGYSSLAYLKRFPIDAIKIDRSFVRDIPADADDAAIVEAIVAMAHRLRVTVVAEGVETVTQRDFLQSLAVQRGQGYLYARPMTLEKLAETFTVTAEPAAVKTR
jgi:diguanylate cyclase (GGDEF)-like protein/PAS domain S-box-containing protein